MARTTLDVGHTRHIGVLLGCLMAMTGGALAATGCVSPEESKTNRLFGTSDDEGTGNGDAGSTTQGGGSGGANGGLGGDLGGLGTPDPTGAGSPDAACAASSYQAEQIITEIIVETPVTTEIQTPVTTIVEVPVTTVVNEPVAFYIMLDQSLSMNDVSGATSKWAAATSSITTFVNDPNSTGLDVAFNEFAGGVAFLDTNCSGSQYANPLVAMGALPSNATNVTNALASTGPSGLGTNIEPGLRAATDGCIAHQTATGERCIVIFVSDGQPNVCSGDAAVLSGIAGAAYTSYGVQTFSVAMAGADFNIMNQIAQAGGTDCDPNGPNYACDIQQDASAFIDALNQIRETTVVTSYVTETVTEYVTEYQTEIVTEIQQEVVQTPVECEWVVPEPPAGEEFDKEQVNVQVSMGTTLQRVGYIASPGDCAAADGGWYYDDPDAPTKILVCDQTCGVIQSVQGARVDVLLGCATEPAILR